MKVYGTKEIRNVGIVGHGHAGKTSLVSAILYDAGATPRFGRVDEGSTVTDYDEDEIARKTSIHSGLAYVEWNGTKINLIDTPGFAAFILDAKGALRAADAALVVVDSINGVEVQTEKGWSFAEELDLPRLLVVSKMDKERANFEATVNSITEAFGRAAVPLQLPIGSESQFQGVIDLVHMRAYTYEKDGSGKPKEGDIPADLQDAAATARERIIDDHDFLGVRAVGLGKRAAFQQWRPHQAMVVRAHRINCHINALARPAQRPPFDAERRIKTSGAHWHALDDGCVTHARHRLDRPRVGEPALTAVVDA